MIFTFPEWARKGNTVVFEGVEYTIANTWITGDRCSDWGMLDLTREVGMFAEDVTVRWNEVKPKNEGKKVSKNIERLVARKSK